MVVDQEVGFGPRLHERIVRRKGRKVMLYALESKDWPWSPVTTVLKSFWIISVCFWNTKILKWIASRSQKSAIWIFHSEHIDIYIHAYISSEKCPFGMNTTLPENGQLGQIMPNKISFYFTFINILQNILKVDLRHVVIYCKQGVCFVQSFWRLFLKWFGL